MKKKLIVEIDYSEENGLWGGDTTGIQAFHDSVVVMAHHGMLKMLSASIMELAKQGVSGEDLQSNSYYQYIMRQDAVINSVNPCGYIDEHNVVHEYNNKTGKWESK